MKALVLLATGMACSLAATAATFTVTTVLDGGVGSLRQAILDANANLGPDLIAFAIPDGGVQAIAPASALPPITDPVTIDGYTQPGARTNSLALGSDAVLLIELTGTNLAGGRGLHFASSASNCVVRGLVVNGFDYGLSADPSSGHIFEGNFIGTDATGTSIPPGNRGVGIFITGGGGHRIGGASPGARNVLSGHTNGGIGLWLSGGAGNHILGNYIGLGADGTTPVENDWGIYCASSSNRIGGTSSLERNVISANRLSGTRDFGPGGNVYLGNFIGTDASGTLARGNGNGLIFGEMSAGNIVGGTNAGAGNVISGNGSGLALGGHGGHIVMGNLVGTDVTGRRGLGNAGDGISLGSNNVVGGAVPAARNVVVANLYGLIMHNPGATGNRVQGNFIGTDVTGTNALGNGWGVYVLNAPGNLIGGTADGEGNIISGNTLGVHIVEPAASNTVVQGNFIGTDVSGARGLGNSTHGVLVRGPNNRIGSSSAGARNVISGNGLCGIVIEGGAGTVVEGNFVGADLTGTNALPNHDGISIISAQGCRIGGLTPGSRNVISGHASSLGIYLLLATDNQILGNYIGLGADGTTPIGNSRGIWFQSAPRNQIGGTAPGAGNVISGNGVGCWLNAGDSNVFQGNFIGTDASGTLFRGNRTGLEILSSGNLFGGADAGAGNLISGNGRGFYLTTAGSSNVIRGNLIGTDVTGGFALGNTNYGVFIESPGNRIGGETPGARNIISGTPGPGAAIHIGGALASGNTVAGNLIGTDVSGTIALGNAAGISVSGPNNTIGGLTVGARNIIAGNTTAIGISSETAGGNQILGNYIGLGPDGVTAVGNALYGIYLHDATNSIVGGASPAARNVISANDIGLFIGSGGGHIIQGNYIGTDATGTLRRGNLRQGIQSQSSANNTFGGATPGAGNVISGNGGYGMDIVSDASGGTRLEGNLIGTDSSGTTLLGNGSIGVLLQESSAGLTIGGINLGAGNIIAGNGDAGISHQAATNIAILGNRIFANAGLGIDLGGNGVTPNDPGDLDGSPNHRQNFPVLLTAQGGAGSVVLGALDSLPGKDYRLEFFASSAADPSGFGEGEIFLGATSATTGANGRARFAFVPQTPLLVGQFLTATATDPDGNTSEFSLAARVIPFGTPNILVNGVLYSTNTVTVSNTVKIEIQTAFANGVILYTLDGSPPSIGNGTVYSGPFGLNSAAVIRAVAYGPGFGTSAESDALTVLFRVEPAIVEPPRSQTVVAGSAVAFAVMASGSAPLSYQWFFDLSPMADATSATLTLANVQPNQAGSYVVAVSNAFGFVLSPAVALTVLTPPGITAGPMSTNVPLGSNVTFCVTATGTPPLQFQWRKNNANLAGATNACFSLTNVQLSDGASYSVVVANEAGAVLSASAELAVTVPSPPAPDNFTNRVVLTGSQGTNTGSNAFATLEPGEPRHAGKPGGASVWYAWTPPATGIARFLTSGSTFDTLLGIYTGTSVAQLQAAASDEDRGGFLTSEVTFNATNGTQYQIAIDGVGGAMGSFVLRWDFAAAPDLLPTIQTQPCDVTLPLGGTHTFTVTAAPEPLRYQWLFRGGEIPLATNQAYTVTNAGAPDVGFYTVRVSNATTQTLSRAALLEIGPFPELQSREKLEDLQAAAPCAGGGPDPAPVFTAQSAFRSVAAGSIATHLIESTSTNNLSDCIGANCGGILTGARFLSLIPDDNATLVIDTSGSAARTVLWVCQRVNNAAPRTFVQCDQNSAPDGRSRVRFATTNQNEYLVWVGRLDPAAGSLQVNWAFGHPPLIASQSPNQLVAQGQTGVVLQVQATNRYSAAVNATNRLPLPTYQWLHNGQPLAGMTNDTLTLDGVQLADAGTYTVVASNRIGATSRDIRLEVVAASNAPPIVPMGVRTQLVAFVSAANCSASYQWRLNGVNLTGRTNTILELPNTQMTNAGQYSLVVSNCIGSLTGAVALVQVNAQVPLILCGADRLDSLRFEATNPVRGFVLETATNLAEALTNRNAWRPIVTNLNFNSLPCLAEPTNSPGRPQQFYRGRLLP